MVGVVGINIDPPPHVQDEAAQIVDAMDVVGMRMREEHAVEGADAGGERLLAKVRTGIDEHVGDAARGRNALRQQRAAQPPVPWIGGIAGAPIPADARNAGRRAAAEDGEAIAVGQVVSQRRGTLEKRRKKFSVVCAAISAGVTPRVWASIAAVWVT